MPFSVSEVAAWIGGRVANAALLGDAISSIYVERPAVLAKAQSSELAFFFSREYQNELPQTRAGIIITGEDFVKPMGASGLPFWKLSAVVACADPYLAMGIMSEKFAAELSSVSHITLSRQGVIHSSAVVHESAEISLGVSIGPQCVVEEGTRIGAGTILYPGCYIGRGVKIGSGCVLFPRVTLYEWVELGDRVRIHAGSVLGSDGFGYAPRRDGKTVIGHQKIYHLGRVIVGDDVEIGALVSVDRGTFGNTVIEKNAKLDNQVHLGHNSHVEEGGILCGGTCLAGRAGVGKYAYVGGLTGIANGVRVGDRASVGALALVTKDVPEGGTAVGNPQRDFREHFRAHAKLNLLIKSATRSKEKTAKVKD
jgi:UDP-3-O-[3-hydroxymyristoyl] glucosamine N-acyltransferase